MPLPKELANELLEAVCDVSSSAAPNLMAVRVCTPAGGWVWRSFRFYPGVAAHTADSPCFAPVLTWALPEDAG